MEMLLPDFDLDIISFALGMFVVAFILLLRDLVLQFWEVWKEKEKHGKK